MTRLTFDELSGGAPTTIEATRLLVAGFTGRDQELVEEHIVELANLGVPVPEVVPSLYTLDPGLLTQSEDVRVGGQNTSGEVEPVLIRAGERWLLTVGSDHTDRDLEQIDIHASKAACPKIVGRTCIDLARVEHRDAVELSSRIADGVVYQQGGLHQLLPLEALLEHLSDAFGVTVADGDVIFMGTVPAIGGIRPSPAFQASISAPGFPALTLSYSLASDDGRQQDERLHT